MHNLKYYLNSEVRITNEHHPHYNSVGKVTGQNEKGLIIFRFDKQTQFNASPEDIKITKR
ncbi:hypothetical protein [Pedobacter sp. MW01-1-1]|uniref:hypothetical protein n=1 Tax=Pedobacter sp. MW01-1-1 TaxID=3383027 RepID=UPI003FEDB10A